MVETTPVPLLKNTPYSTLTPHFPYQHQRLQFNRDRLCLGSAHHGSASESILSGKRCLHSSMPSCSGTKNGPMVPVACDKTATVGGINKRSILGPAIRPLSPILPISVVFDIEIKAHWVPTEEKVIADAASQHDFKKLANPGLKDQVFTF